MLDSHVDKKKVSRVTAFHSVNSTTEPKPNTTNNNSNNNNNSNTSSPSINGNYHPNSNTNSSSPWCQNCQTNITPLWRRDESGQILCNACGLFLKLHGRPRPISLKTDVIKSRNRNKVNHQFVNSSPQTVNNNPNAQQNNNNNNNQNKSPQSTTSSNEDNNNSNNNNNNNNNTHQVNNRQRNGPKTRKRNSHKETKSPTSPLPHSKHTPAATTSNSTTSSSNSSSYGEDSPLLNNNNNNSSNGGGGSHLGLSKNDTLPPLLATLDSRTQLPSIRNSPLLNGIGPKSPKDGNVSLKGLNQNNNNNYQPHFHNILASNPGSSAYLRASYHGTPIADSIISNHSLKAITSPLLLATSQGLNSSKNSMSLKSISLDNNTNTSTASSTTSNTSITCNTAMKSLSSSSNFQSPALDQLSKAACTSPYLAPLPQQSDTRRSPNPDSITASKMKSSDGYTHSSKLINESTTSPILSTTTNGAATIKMVSSNNNNSFDKKMSDLNAKSITTIPTGPSEVLSKANNAYHTDRRITELELVNDLLNTKIRELEEKEQTSRETEAIIRKSELLLRVENQRLEKKVEKFKTLISKMLHCLSEEESDDNNDDNDDSDKISNHEQLFKALITRKNERSSIGNGAYDDDEILIQQVNSFLNKRQQESLSNRNHQQQQKTISSTDSKNSSLNDIKDEELSKNSKRKSTLLSSLDNKDSESPNEQEQEQEEDFHKNKKNKSSVD